MKRWIAILLAATMLLSLCACGGADSGQESFVEVQSEIDSQIIVEEAEESVIEDVAVPEVADDNAGVIEFSDVVVVSDDNITIELVNFFGEEVNWAEGARNEKCVSFKVTNKSSSDILVGMEAYLDNETMWVCQNGGSSEIKAGKTANLSYYIDYDTKPAPTELESLDVLNNLECVFDVSVKDGNTIVNSYEVTCSFLNCIGGSASESEATTSEADAEKVMATDYMTVEGIYVDESYVDEDSASLRMVYLFYTVTTPGENLKVDSKSTILTIGGKNEYSSSHYAKACRYMSSYYYSDYLEDVYVGDVLKVVETFVIPSGDLVEGKEISLSKHQVPDSDKIKFTTDDIVFCESPEAIAQIADPDGYALEIYNRSPADSGTVSAVRNAINGYYWDIYVNSTSYELEFYAPNSFEMRVPAFGITNGGTYEVQNGYVVCTYTSTGLTLEIPYTWSGNDIDLRAADALDVNEN